MAYWREIYKENNVEPATLGNKPGFIRDYIADLEDNEIGNYKTSWQTFSTSEIRLIPQANGRNFENYFKNKILPLVEI